MVKIDNRVKNSYFEYLDRHRLLEKIDSAISENFKGKYFYADNEVEFHTNIDRKSHIKKDNFATDLVYISENRNAILMIEETLNPSDKKINYWHMEMYHLNR